MSGMNNFSSGCSDEPLEGNRRVHPEGREYYERAGKTSDNWYAHEGGALDPKPEARLRSDAAQANALKNRGSMADNMKGYANPAPQRTVHPRAVKGEAAAIAQGNKGGGMRNLMENYGNLEISPRPGPKVSTCVVYMYNVYTVTSLYSISAWNSMQGYKSSHCFWTSATPP